MGFRIEERFPVRASPDAVFAYLLDARRVVTCLPGAELSEAIDARTYRGKMTVKVGPVTVAYDGRVLLTEVDAPARRVRLIGEAREGTGAGSARMTLESVTSASADGAEVAVEADVDVAGRAVQLGRGMMEQIARQVFREFAARLRAALEAGAAASAGTATARGAPLAGVTAATEASAPPARPQPLRALPLLWRAAWTAVAALFRRWFGRSGRSRSP